MLEHLSLRKTQLLIQSFELFYDFFDINIPFQFVV